MDIGGVVEVPTAPQPPEGVVIMVMGHPRSLMDGADTDLRDEAVMGIQGEDVVMAPHLGATEDQECGGGGHRHPSLDTKEPGHTIGETPRQARTLDLMIDNHLLARELVLAI